MAAVIGSGNEPFRLFIGYLIGGGLMIVGVLVEAFLGVPAQKQPLEAIARPLSAVVAVAQGRLLPRHAALGDSRLSRRISSHGRGLVMKSPRYRRGPHTSSGRNGQRGLQ